MQDEELDELEHFLHLQDEELELEHELEELEHFLQLHDEEVELDEHELELEDFEHLLQLHDDELDELDEHGPSELSELSMGWQQ